VTAVHTPFLVISYRRFPIVCVAITLLSSLSGCANVATVLESDSLREGIRREPLSESDVDEGLREALRVATREAVRRAGRTNGFLSNPDIVIDVPPSLSPVETTLRRIGLGEAVDTFVAEMNRAAELAADEATPILTGAIRELTMQDAWDILQGDATAATDHLEDRTRDDIYAAFKPIVDQSLDRTGAMEAYDNVMGLYQRSPLAEEIPFALSDYTTTKAIDGLFHLMAEEEQRIREDPMARTTDLLRRVFGTRVYER